MNDWKWFGHAGHLIVGRWCRFHLCTQVGGYLISTVGEYWPERMVREVHAEVHDPQWLADNSYRKGDDFDAAYVSRFGFEDIGCDRKYETMVFKAGEPCTADGCDCGMPVPDDWTELASEGYQSAGKATNGHIRMCRKYEEMRAEIPQAEG